MRASTPILCVCLWLGACATIDRGTVDFVRVDTVPQGASVTMVGDNADAVRAGVGRGRFQPKTKSCVTPCALPFSRQAEVLVRIKQDGYAPFEYMVTSSNLRGSASASAAKSAAVTSGSGALMGLWAAAWSNLFNQLFTFGTAPAVSSGGFVSAGTGIGLGVSVASLAVDVGTGANRNFFPNPTVIGLAPDGTDVQTDPLVAPFKALIELEREQVAVCDRKSARHDADACDDVFVERSKARDRFVAMRRERDAEVKALARTIKAANEAAQEATP